MTRAIQDPVQANLALEVGVNFCEDSCRRLAKEIHVSSIRSGFRRLWILMPHPIGSRQLYPASMAS